MFKFMPKMKINVPLKWKDFAIQGKDINSDVLGKKYAIICAFKIKDFCVLAFAPQNIKDIKEMFGYFTEILDKSKEIYTWEIIRYSEGKKIDPLNINFFNIEYQDIISEIRSVVADKRKKDLELSDVSTKKYKNTKKNDENNNSSNNDNSSFNSDAQSNQEDISYN